MARGTMRARFQAMKLSSVRGSAQMTVWRNFKAQNSNANILFAVAAFVLLSVVSNGSAFAGYPDRIVKIVVPFAPGGGTDVVARTLGQEMTHNLGVNVVIENKPGAGTIIGT
jgi:hypothetical protein